MSEVKYRKKPHWQSDEDYAAELRRKACPWCGSRIRGEDNGYPCDSLNQRGPNARHGWHDEHLAA